ncbi:MAG: hypothetical protein M9894_30065 [Planctomycetes bacterium]|nr:hypothetical protein [Planctomycetota bacterium]
MQVDTLSQRWRLVYTRLNEVHAPAEDAGVWRQRLAWQWLADLLHTPVPRRLVLRARHDDRETGPPCPVCAVVVARVDDLVACTACLRVSHEACLPGRRACPCGQPG